MFGVGSPMERIVLSVGLRQKLTGFLFGGVDATIAQLIGACVGSVPLLAFGATLPGENYPTGTVDGRVVTTFALIAGSCVFIRFPDLRRFTLPWKRRY